MHRRVADRPALMHCQEIRRDMLPDEVRPTHPSGEIQGYSETVGTTRLFRNVVQKVFDNMLMLVPCRDDHCGIARNRVRTHLRTFLDQEQHDLLLSVFRGHTNGFALLPRVRGLVAKVENAGGLIEQGTDGVSVPAADQLKYGWIICHGLPVT